jgi:hypothetical protein
MGYWTSPPGPLSDAERGVFKGVMLCECQPRVFEREA